MEVKPAERRVEKSFTPNSEAHMEMAMDRSALPSAAAPELQKLSQKIGRFVAHAQAYLLHVLRGITLTPRVSKKVGPRSVSMSGATPKLTSTMPAAGIVVAEITDLSMTFTDRDLSTVYCLDLDKFSLVEVAGWIAHAQETNRPLPQIIVVAPQHRLSNSDLEVISEEIAPMAVFMDRPASSFDDVLRIVREQVNGVLEPERVTVKTSFEAVGEAHGLVFPRA